MTSELSVKKQTYLGLFMVTLATLMYEILLTRIFSVTMWYHYAFVAISVALFGTTVGALMVYLLPGYFTQAKAKYHLGVSALLFAIYIVISFLIHLSIPFVTGARSTVEICSVVLTYIVTSIPFIFSGICVSLALTKFPDQVSKLYAADLTGAALGCVLLIYVLKITDGPTAVIVVALLAGIGAILFFGDTDHKRLMQITIIFTLILALFAATHTVLVYRQSPWLRLIWVKDQFETPPIYEAWNSFSRVRVIGNPDIPEVPFSWGLSPAHDNHTTVRQLHLKIDASAGTVMTAFDGNLNELDYLKYDITNLAHYLRAEADVLVVGVGGGRDILSALIFEQKSVVGVELNENIIKIVNKEFGDFTGHLDKYPEVTFVNDEARSYIARSEDEFDIIQISFADSWAATTAGAFALSENSLYTVEAWQSFLNHLTPNGLLSISRWYFRGLPGEMYRLTSLAGTALREQGVENPREHVIIVRYMRQSSEWPDGIGTILVSKAPFSNEEIATIEKVARQLQFELVFSPNSSLDPTFAKLTVPLTSTEEPSEFMAGFPLNITPPSDDKPFFFHMLRFQDIFRPEKFSQGIMSFNIKAVNTLGILLITVFGLTVLGIIVPLALTAKKQSLKGTWPLFFFFAAIGFGFILVEISQIQRLVVFLGHPTYCLSVVLFSLLLSSGLGSYLTQKINSFNLVQPAIRNLLLLLGVLIIFGTFTPYIINTFQASTTSARILVTVAALFPIGIFMGMAFPLGMRMASNQAAALTPWFWGVNGGTSVCGSVLAVAIAMTAGISTSFWIGVACYGIALASFISATKTCSSN